MNSRNQTFVIYLLLFMAIITMLFFNFQQQAAEVRTIPINQLAADIEAGKVSKVVANGDDLTITYKTLEIKESVKEPNSGLIDQLAQLGVTPEKLQDQSLSIEIKKTECLDWDFGHLSLSLAHRLYVRAAHLFRSPNAGLK